MTISSATLTNGSGSSATNANSYTTSALTPTANRLIIVQFNAVRVGGANLPTISGLSGGSTLSFTQIATITSGAYRLTSWWAPTGSSPGTGTITFSLGGVTHLNGHWHVYEIDGVDLAMATPIAQTSTGTGTGTAVSVSLSTFQSASNGTIAGCVAADPSATWTPESSPIAWTELYDTQLSDTIGAHSTCQSLWTPDNDPSPSTTETTSNAWGMWAAEIIAAYDTTAALPIPVGGQAPVLTTTRMVAF